ncbi:GNAT family N-acetyltransferase [Cellvibrio sp. QJXJ]|jgi:ribosomal protein S18 acetylase RimI-like enzyme|uniref:GNAT family N-acetyltransferase n=1 Tax=Cellvibrio sp. QJXJ TaxID=2964606 RepID=UPI0021C2D252|nr:GNAT family N-acetyltransferase [Cellvibrio sp. QJXJ]UUA74058.1 GNAT family N-acetyltransferase [Cellvibrio sp. QJXJ]
MEKNIFLPAGICVRLADATDDAFLFSLFCEARPELAYLPLPPAQVETLLAQQYQLQQRGYANQYPTARNWIIECESQVVGKIMLAELVNFIHIVDFVIAFSWRSRGIGSAVLNAAKHYASAQSLGLSLQVERQNIAAKRLYTRIGFNVCQLTATHEAMECK